MADDLYVYDDFSRLRAVLPPQATTLLLGNGQQVSAAVDSPLFYYRYDGRGRVLAKRLVKRQQMQWTKKGAHLLVQARTKALNEEWEDCFRQQYPGFRPLPVEPVRMAA